MEDDRETTIRLRANHARACFEQNLAQFVKMWAPHDSMRESDRFQRDLMMLLRDAMEHKSHTYGLHIERTEAMLDALSMHATASLRAIYANPEIDKRQSAMDIIRRQMAKKKED